MLIGKLQICSSGEMLFLKIPPLRGHQLTRVCRSTLHLNPKIDDFIYNFGRFLKNQIAVTINETNDSIRSFLNAFHQIGIEMDHRIVETGKFYHDMGL